MANDRHFFRRGEDCVVMTLQEIKKELCWKENSFGLWVASNQYEDKVLAFLPNEYGNMGRVGKVLKAEYDYYADVEFPDGDRLAIPCLCLKVLKPSVSEEPKVEMTISGICREEDDDWKEFSKMLDEGFQSLREAVQEHNSRVVKPVPEVQVDDIVALEENDFSDISNEFFDVSMLDDFDDIEDVEIEDDRKHLVCDAYAEVIKARVRVGEVLEELDKAIKVFEELLEE